MAVHWPDPTSVWKERSPGPAVNEQEVAEPLINVCAGPRKDLRYRVSAVSTGNAEVGGHFASMLLALEDGAGGRGETHLAQEGVHGEALDHDGEDDNDIGDGDEAVVRGAG